MALITSIASGGWFTDAATVWDSGAAPVYGDTVIIDDGHIVELDGDCECGSGTYPSDSSPYDNAGWSLQLKGTLKASHTVDSSLAVDGLMNYSRTADTGHSTLDFEDIPENINFEWKLNPRGSFTNARSYYYSCSLYANSSDRTPAVKISSAYHRRRNTYIEGEVSAGDTTFTVENAEGWKVGDVLVLTPRFTSTTQYNTNHEYEEATISAISGNDITVSAGLTYDHGYADTEDYPAAAISNKTSNVQINGYDNSTGTPGLYILRADIKIKDVVGDYLNNIYGLNTDVLRLAHLGIYSTINTVIESNYFTADYSGYSGNLYGVLYTNSVYDTYEIVNVKDTVIHFIPNTAYRGYYGFDSYYTGRAVKITDCNCYCSANYHGGSMFNDYQQPATYDNCKAFNSTYGFMLHDNAMTTANDCWSIGCNYGTNSYNGTSNFVDHHFRFVQYLGTSYAGWMTFANYIRPDFDAKHLLQTDPANYFYQNSVPDGNVVYFNDMQNDTDQQRWFYSFGQKWWELTTKRNDPYSIGMSSTSDTYIVPHERTFDATTGDSMLVGLYVRNLSASYVGTLTLSILQGSTTIVTEDFDLTTLTVDEWTLLSVSGTATKTMTTTFKMEYKGNGGEIALTDFSQPFTASEKSQAKAVWAELLSENSVSGSFGESIASIEADTDDLQTNQGDWLTATGFATQNPPSQNLDDYKADVSALALEASLTSHDNSIDSQLSTIQTDLDNTDQYKADVTALATEANVETHVTNSLNAYDPPTRAEVTSDKDEIITQIDANETKIDAIPTNPLLTTDTRVDHLDADVSTRSSHSASDVWANGSRTLTAGTKDSEIDEILADTDEVQVKTDELHKIHGLDAANPMTVTPASRVSGGVSQAISGDGETTTTVTRS